MYASAAMRVLVFEPGSFPRRANILNHWAISPAPSVNSFVKKNYSTEEKYQMQKNLLFNPWVPFP